MGLSVWLVPSEEQSSLLQRLMSRHPSPSSDSDSKSTSYPTFYPHITLGSFPTSTTSFLNLRESIPLGISSLPLSFASVRTGDHYFRSIYVAVKPTKDLQELYEGLHRAMGIDEPKSPAFPHLSLYYIDEKDAEKGERERMFGEMVRSGVVQNLPAEEGVVLDCGVGTVPEPDPDAMVRLDGIVGSEIWIVKCEGPVEGWEVMDKILLATAKH